MVVSALVYLSLMGLMILTGRFSYTKPLKEGRYNNPLVYCFIPSLLYAFVFGIRYGVGTDHLRYIESYLYGIDREMEPGYVFLERLFSNSGLHFAWFFGFIAFLQVSLYLSAFKDRRICPWIILVLMLGCRWLGWCNGIRQSMAFCIFVFSIQFIEEKKPIPYVLLILLAMLFHRSAMLLLPFYFIGKVDLFKIKWIPWFVYGVALLIQNTNIVSSFVASNFDLVSSFFGYDEAYSAEVSLEKITFEEGKSSGLGILIGRVTTIVILAFMPSARRYYNSSWFIILSNLFLIGLLGSTMFNGVVVLLRPFGYFTPFRGIIIAYLLCYFFTNKTENSVVWSCLLIVSLVFSFVATIYRGDINTAEYHVFWEFQ